MPAFVRRAKMIYLGTRIVLVQLGVVVGAMVVAQLAPRAGADAMAASAWPRWWPRRRRSSPRSPPSPAGRGGEGWSPVGTGAGTWQYVGALPPPPVVADSAMAAAIPSVSVASLPQARATTHAKGGAAHGPRRRRPTRTAPRASEPDEQVDTAALSAALEGALGN